MKGLFGRLLTTLCALALIFVVATVALPALFGLQRFVITGGSMTGSIPKGSVIYSRLTPVGELRVGDVITFTPPGFSTAVTHRIIAVGQGDDGAPVFSTKGDYNQVADPWNPVALNEPQQARYAFHVPLLGYVLAALATRAVRMALVGLPALIIALSILWSLWRQAGEEVARAAEDEGIPHDARSRA